MRAFRGVDKAQFMAHVLECRRFGLWRRGGYYHAAGLHPGCGCLVGLGAVVAGRMLGDDGLEALPAFQAGDFYAAAGERLGLPPDLCRALDFLFQASPDDDRAGELAELFYECVPELADLSGAAAAYSAALEELGEGAAWEDRAEAMLAAVAAAG